MFQNRFYCGIFPVVFQGDEELGTDGQVGRLATLLVQFVVCGPQDVEHGLEDSFGRSGAVFEFFV